jgi:hypothetical protein
VISDKLRDGISHIIHHGKLNQKRDQIQEGVVPRLIIPGQDREGALRLKHVRGRGVVNDYRILKGATHQRKVLNEHIIHVGTVLTEEPVRTETLGVHHIHEGVSILR